MTLEIIGFPQSNFVRTVRMVAEEKGVPYELSPVTPHSPEARAVHPMGHVPGLRHDGLELFESMAIAQYINASFDGPDLSGGDARGAAQVNQWIAFVASTVDQTLMRRYVVQYVFNKDADGNTDRTLIDMAVKSFKRLFAVLEEGVEPGFLGSKTLTIADCFVAPILEVAVNFPEAKEIFEGCPNLKSYMTTMNARPSFADTAS